MKWKKLGMVYETKGIHPLLTTHASNPLATHLRDNVFRIYYSGRDSQNKSSVGWVDIDIITGVHVDHCKEPVIRYFDGNGAFYSHGISIGNIYECEGRKYILFMGWQIPEGEHWRGDVGQLELSDDLESMSLTSDRPFMGVDQEDLISLSYPCVIKDKGKYRMWYGSTISWDSPNGEMIHVIKYAESDDGSIWEKHGIAVPWEIGKAQAFSRPTVVVIDNQYHMWFSYRRGGGDKYKIGYATSLDGLTWDRQENSGIETSHEGWDSEMVCYPFVFEHLGHTYMLYNGNAHGYNGFGLAVLE